MLVWLLSAWQYKQYDLEAAHANHRILLHGGGVRKGALSPWVTCVLFSFRNILLSWPYGKKYDELSLM